MAKLPPDYPTSDEISELLSPIPNGIEDRKRQGWQPNNAKELFIVACNEIDEIRKLFKAGWTPKIWGEERKLILPFLTYYILSGYLRSNELLMLRYLVYRKFISIGEIITDSEQTVLREFIVDRRVLETVKSFKWERYLKEVVRQ